MVLSEERKAAVTQPSHHMLKYMSGGKMRSLNERLFLVLLFMKFWLSPSQIKLKTTVY